MLLPNKLIRPLPHILFLSNAILQTISFTLASRLSGAHILGPPYIISDELLNIFSFIPAPLRDYFALIFVCRYDILAAASSINSFLPMCVVPVAFIAMLSTSTIKEEDIYPLLRVDRNKLLLTRSVLNALFYTGFVTAIVWLTKSYLILNDPNTSMVAPILEAFTPILAVIPATFLFLLMLQSLAALINLYSSRATFIIPSILLIELIIIQLPVIMFSAGLRPSISPMIQSMLSILLYSGMGAMNEFMTFFIFQFLASNSLTISLANVSRFLLLNQLGGLMHVFSPLFGGVWNMNLFDPKYLPYTLFLSLPEIIFTNPLASLLLTPYMTLLTLIIELLAKTPFYPWLNCLYVLVIPILVYSLTTILYGRQTL